MRCNYQESCTLYFEGRRECNNPHICNYNKLFKQYPREVLDAENPGELGKLEKEIKDGSI